MHAVAPVDAEKLVPSMQGVHTVVPADPEKKPGEQEVHTLSDVIVQGV